MEEENKNIMKEPQPDYEKAEMDQLREALKLSYTERFFKMTKLMKRSRMVSQAKKIYPTNNKRNQ